MSLLEKEICHYTETIWHTLLGQTVSLAPDSSHWAESEEIMVCCVDISGSWEGTVALHYPIPLARKAAACMFDQTPETITQDQIQSIMNELGNMTAGNIKGLMEDPCHLSLPTLMSEKDYPLDFCQSDVASQYVFQCMDSNFAISIKSKNHTPPPLLH